MKFNKSGVISAAIQEEIHIEPDGSMWFPVFLHVNPANQKFLSDDSFEDGVYKNNLMWLNFGICKRLTSWEFLAFQSDTESSEIKKYRWSQSKSPFTATRAEVAPSNITKVTDGYNDAGSYGGGFYVANSDKSYIITSDNADNAIWGAVGCKVSYQNGIPGFGGSVCTTGIMTVYVRISSSQLSLLKNPDSIITNEFIEI